MDNNPHKGIGRQISKGTPYKIEGKNYLLVIGIDKYNNQNFPPLNNAVRDAQTFKEVLIERYEFYPEYTIALLDEAASRVSILEAFMKLERSVKKNDNLIIFFSGHGILNAKKTRGFWVPNDAKSQIDCISTSEIIETIKDIQAHHIYLIVDSCFSGNMVKRSSKYKDQVESLPSRRILTSGRTETVSDGRPGNHSPFSACLIEYLRSFDDSELRSSHLEEYVKTFTARSATQTPSAEFLYNTGDQGGEFVFRLKRQYRKDSKITSSKNIEKKRKIRDLEIMIEASKSDEPIKMLKVAEVFFQLYTDPQKNQLLQTLLFPALSELRNSRHQFYETISVEKFKKLCLFIKEASFPLHNENRITPAELQYINGGWFKEWVYHHLKDELLIKDEKIALNIDLRFSEPNTDLSYRTADILFIYEDRAYALGCRIGLGHRVKARNQVSKGIKDIFILGKTSGMSLNCAFLTLSSQLRNRNAQMDSAITQLSDELNVNIFDKTDLVRPAKKWINDLVQMTL